MNKRLIDLYEDIVLQEVKGYFLSEFIISAEVFNKTSQLPREIGEAKNGVFAL